VSESESETESAHTELEHYWNLISFHFH